MLCEVEKGCLRDDTCTRNSNIDGRINYSMIQKLLHLYSLNVCVLLILVVKCGRKDYD